MQKEEKKGRKKKRVACPYAIGDNIHSIDITKYKRKCHFNQLTISKKEH
jgi:hypothetical protein